VVARLVTTCLSTEQLAVSRWKVTPLV